MTLSTYPSPTHLAALRAWYEGMSARQAVGRYLADSRPSNQSSRALLGRTRRTLVLYASERHRPDLAAPFSAWATWSGPKPKSTFDLVLHNEVLLRKIHDPALRSLVQGISRERDRLRAELDLLKAERTLSVDMRPQTAAGPLRPGRNVELTPSEQDAVKRAVSPEILSREGWSEGPHGEVLTKSGRRVFEVGFLRALRKLVSASDSDA